MIDTNTLRNLFEYNESTGDFVRRVSRSPNARVGDVAGSVNQGGYRAIWIDGNVYLAHRLVFSYLGEEVPKYVDHINGNRLDNRRENLRPCTKVENSRNAKRYKSNTSGVMGVSYCKKTGKWQAKIRVNNDFLWLGRHECFEDAVAARKAAEKEYRFHENHGREQESKTTNEVSEAGE